MVVFTHCAPAIEQLWGVATADVGDGRDLDRGERIEVRQRRLDLRGSRLEVGGLALGAHSAVLRVVHHWPHPTQVTISAIPQAFLDLVERNPGLSDGVSVDLDQPVRLVLPVPITAWLPHTVTVPVCELPHSLILLGIRYLSLLSWRAAGDIPAPLSVVLVSSGPGRHHLFGCARLPSPRRPCRATSP